MISKVLKTIRLELINVSKTSRSSSPITMEKVGSVVALLDGVTFILCLLDVKRYDVLVSLVKEKLRYLELFTLTAKWCIELKRMKGLVTYADDVAYTTMHLCFFVAAYKMEEDGHKELVLDIEFCDLLHKLSPFSHELRQIYPSLLIGSKSSGTKPTMDAKFMSNFVDALKKDLEERLSRDAILKTAFDERIPWLRQGLSYLSRFLSEIVSKCTPLEEFNSLQSHTEALAIEAAIVIYTFCDARMDMKSTDIDHKHFLVQLKFNRVMQEYSEHEYMARELNRFHFKLLLKFKFIKVVIRQMCPNSSTSSTLDHPTIDLLNFLPVNCDIIDSYFSMLKSSKTQSSHSPKMDDILVGFYEYILGNVLLKDETYLTFTVANQVKKYYYGLLLLVTYLVDHPVQSIECMRQNDFLTRFGTFAIVAESAICLIYEEALDSNKSRKVNLVLQFLTITFKLIKSVESLMVLLKDKATLKAEILDLIESAHEELIFLRVFLMDVLTQHTELNELHDLLMRAEVTAHKLGQISDSCYGSFVDGSNTQQMRLSLSDLLQEIESVKGYRPAWYYMLYLSDVKQLLKHIEAEVNMICLKVPHSLGYSFPKTNGLGFLNCFLDKLEDLLRSKLDSVIDLKHQIESFKEGLLCLRSLINHFAEILVEHDEVYGLITSVTEMTYKAEYVIDSCVACSHPLWYKILRISEVVDNIKLENKVVSETCERKKIDVILGSQSQKDGH
ncbi:hypothetical protein RND71_023536 [Anisodus tanguticus]|uniref:Uncharacterized protein n=1 Tax=Anisodus tanguticus TaxID=243964 RepID=A0AAE1VBN8_9SOLA|nr:hypothetical protein RND71_023536 [Anisodus tanguticus]